MIMKYPQKNVKYSGKLLPAWICLRCLWWDLFPIIQITYSHTHFLIISLLPTLPTQAPPFTMRPPMSYFHCFKEGQDHCEECGRCDYLSCIDHFGCTCERGEEEDEYNGSLCASEVRYAITQLNV